MTTSRCEAEPVIVIVAAVVLDGEGRLLLVRKQGTDCFMLPGGKLAPGEGPIEALERELVEELGSGLAAEPRLLGEYEAPAANEPGHRVEASIFTAKLAGAPIACSEICELVWHDPDLDPAFRLAPLARDRVLPELRALRRAA